MDKPDELTAVAGSSGATRPNRLEIWKHIPEDRLLVETDAPTKAPADARNRFPLGLDADGSPINHPANIVVAYEALAELRGLSLDSLTQIVGQNFQRLFG
jgi:TatD DNase family protein